MLGIDMTHEELLLFHKRMCDQRIWVAFKGAISQGILVELGTVVKSGLGLDNKFKKIFSIFVEMTQNVLHYSVEREPVASNNGELVGVGIIVVTETTDCYLISSGNLVDSEQAEHLTQYCTHINSLNEQELKEFYNERRKCAAKQQGSKGAGLGLIDIARKSDRPLEHEVSRIDDSRLFFTLTATIEKRG
ncbi:MAG: SiaB family protein kinase [Acidobacteriota bacterium]|nr:SiaB family protein kinase [Blastocatellia bacterium]MDW8412992.1 SiaB family protein kinase [Acidobacteriota bacterium]